MSFTEKNYIHRRICASDITLIKKSHTLNFYSFFLLLVTVVAQFTAKTANSEKASYLLFVNYIFLFKWKSFTNFMLSELTWKKFLLEEMMGEGGGPDAIYIYVALYFVSLQNC